MTNMAGLSASEIAERLLARHPEGEGFLVSLQGYGQAKEVAEGLERSGRKVIILDDGISLQVL